MPETTSRRHKEDDGDKRIQTKKGIDHYELAKKTIDSWPRWKREFSEKVIRLATK